MSEAERNPSAGIPRGKVLVTGASGHVGCNIVLALLDAGHEVRERYGLIWLFPGERERAASVAMLEIPELEGLHAWGCVPVHFMHAYLHHRL
jgi:hypothetical protein